FPAPLQPLAAGVEIDLPAGELGGEPDVLPVAPDGERELILVDHRLNGLGLGIGEHLRHPRGRQGQAGEPLRIGRPGHDVDAIARISTICCWISGTSSLNSALTNKGSPRERMSRGPFGVSSSRLSTARMVSPWWKCSR